MAESRRGSIGDKVEDFSDLEMAWRFSVGYCVYACSGGSDIGGVGGVS